MREKLREGSSQTGSIFQRSLPPLLGPVDVTMMREVANAPLECHRI